MPLYFSTRAISENYRSLTPIETDGKRNLEQTTALGVFFALDMAQRETGLEELNLDPGIRGGPQGTHRQLLSSLYISFYTPGNTREYIIRELGFSLGAEVDAEADLKKCFSSNFLTVPVKKATISNEPIDYPNRPAPLVSLGGFLTGNTWGIRKHPEWRQNLMVFIEGRLCGGDFFPLIKYLLRNADLSEHTDVDFEQGIRDALETFLTVDLSGYLVDHSSSSFHAWGEDSLFEETSPTVDWSSFQKEEPAEAEEQVPEGEEAEEDLWPEDPSTLMADLVLDEQIVRDAISALKGGKHIILIGPPGSGKTTLAERLAIRMKGENYKTHTATSDWSTHEVLGGYMPDTRQPSNLVFSPGIVIRAIEDNSWLIIDEINRADLDKAFGEMFTFLSGKNVELTQTFQRYDTEGNPVGAPKRIVLDIEQRDYGEDEFECIRCDESWRIIGTMNTFDKASLYQLSFAFMRRFAFIEVPIPSEEQYSALLDRKIAQAIDELTSEDRTDLVERIRYLGTRLKRIFADPSVGLFTSKERAVGPSIPLDIIDYLKERIKEREEEQAGEGEVDQTEKTMLIDALGMFLFPQFEAKRKDHDEIAEALEGALGLQGDSLKDKLRASLAIWTGKY